MEVKPSIFVCPEAGNLVEKNLNDAVIVGEVRPMAQTETKTDGGVGGVQGLDCKADAARSGGSEDQFQDCRIYVSNIPFSFRSRDLIRMFSPFGKVSNAEIVMNERGSKGFGFVTLDSKQGSEAARAALNGIVVNGRVIEVKKATAMPIRRNSTISRPPRPPSVVPPEPNIVPTTKKC
ncbi:hypothetical protein KIN20_021580 [Parelaphostrongylus tenuis]|uniref:RRM domain-containing protein n=1 Tax=Parelaphostrongylus tenuis TaxID=148309 RepID=A0AAD5MPI1_PARTN|nr:hypothetical protein KIN20_021580 [Parelaphostrongylus tenuis]